MARKKLLLPYNFKPNDIKATEFVLQTFRQFEDLEITLFHVYTTVPDIEATGQSVMGKLKSNLGYLNRRIMEMESAFNDVKKQLVEQGISEMRLHSIFRPRKLGVAAEIVAQAQKEHYDFIVLNHAPGRATRFFTGNVFSRVVMALKNTTVCIVS